MQLGLGFATLRRIPAANEPARVPQAPWRGLWKSDRRASFSEFTHKKRTMASYVKRASPFAFEA